ncbi:hypothetical protein JVT61DRAFT_3820 [Boletus reticuloceps]|uniref:Uncharacterized protein n=1 Tax=Boletus reticuloceps TaxID=495285 RepID=A0A8I2YLP4_9AGAM|nr:hypothetical protein JVT61DRAFT_3820 [Boletus reticuloceps]
MQWAVARSVRFIRPLNESILAAKAVRLACNSGAFRDAHFIINSLHSSNHPSAPPPEPISFPFMPAFQFTPITFDRPISPRLSAHVMLHHIIRNESPLKAYETAQILLKNGIPLRQTTLVKVTQALLQAPPSVFRVLKEKGASMFRSPAFFPDSLPINPDAVQDDGLRFALMLLLKARENRHQCSDRAFEALVNFCLLQGEIIMGSLLFVLLVKDYETKAQKAQEIKARITEQEMSQGAASPQLIDRWKELVRSRIPPKRLLKAITHQCEEELSDDSQDREDALQVLAHLAGLIDTRSLPFSDISHLLRVLYSCPKLPDTVVLIQGNSERAVNAYQYFHRVIFGLLQDLPTRKAKDPPDKHQGKRIHVMPPLSRETYNSLVHYALRHRLSVSLARDVLHHMEHVRRPTLKPDTTTYNIIVRSGTLLRRNDIVSFAVAELRKLKENSDHGIAVPSPTPHRHPRSGSSSQSLSELLAVSPATSNIPADMYTLTSYITHLTSTGNPHVVASILFHVLPELAIIDHPAWGDNPPCAHERVVMARRARQEKLNRAVSLGPHFFTSVLNALSKAGKTGLAERVWLLAKQAEKISWIKAGSEGLKLVEGWCLPVHAYTIMMQVYAAEARKGLCVHAHLPVASLETEKHTWRPRTNGKIKVKGWAHFVLAKDKIASRHRSRRTLGLRMGVVLYRSMFRAARDIYDTLIRIVPNAQPRVYNLQPDARFFNAALEMLERQPGTMRRSVKTRPAHWRQKERKAMMRYSRRGVVPRKCNPFLQRVVHGMVDAGFEVPMAYRRQFLGTWLYASMNRPGAPVVNRQPLGFPRPKKRFSPHALPTYKERGLPIQRSEWKKAGQRWKHRRRHLLGLERKGTCPRT